jgi:hypothetical protein
MHKIYNDEKDIFVRYVQEKDNRCYKSRQIKVIVGLQANDDSIHKYIKYNHFESKITKIPKQYFKDEKSYIFKKYFCGTKIIITKNLIENNQHTNYNNKYLTHDNGGRPFFVGVLNNDVSIYKINEKYLIKDNMIKNDMRDVWLYTVLVKKYTNCEEIFVGKNLNISCFKNIYDYGNSVLLHISENKYIFIGTVIYQFDMEKNDCVINYFSKIGNNDVPYPIIEGKENVYFMLDLAYVKKKYTSNKTFENMYTEYYDKLQNKSKSMENIEIIHERLY